MSRISMVLAALCATLFAAPLEARQTQAPAAAPAAPTEIEVPFNPPLGRPLRYRSTIVTNRSGRAATASSDYEIIFSSRSSGFRMQVRVIHVDSPALSVLPEEHRATARRLALERMPPPYVLLLDADGLPEGMEDADAYWENVVRQSVQTIRTEPGRAGDETGIDFAASMLREASPEVRLTMLTQYIGPVIEYGSANYLLGEPIDADVAVEGLMGQSVTQHVSLTAERVENGRLFLSLRGAVAEEEMRRAMVELLARVPVTGQGRNTETERARTEAEFRDARIERTIEGTFQVALDTGLIHRLDTTDRTVVRTGEGTQTITQSLRIERLD